VLTHPAYSSDQAHSDFYLFGAFKDGLLSTDLETDDDVISVVSTWLHEHEKTRYREGIHTLVLCWCRSVEVDENFVQK